MSLSLSPEAHHAPPPPLSPIKGTATGHAKKAVAGAKRGRPAKLDADGNPTSKAALKAKADAEAEASGQAPKKKARKEKAAKEGMDPNDLKQSRRFTFIVYSSSPVMRLAAVNEVELPLGEPELIDISKPELGKVPKPFIPRSMVDIDEEGVVTFKDGKQLVYEPLPIDEKLLNFVCYQLERGPEHGKPHFQGYVEFRKPVRFGALHAMWPSCQPRVKAFKSTVENQENYTLKADSRIGDGQQVHWGIAAEPGKSTRQQELTIAMQAPGADVKTLAAAFPDLWPRLHNGVKAFLQDSTVYDVKDTVLAHDFEKDGFRKWQIHCNSIIDGPPHPRNFYWFYDRPGNSGKSQYSLYLQKTRNVFLAGNSTKKDDIIHALSTLRPFKDIVILDLSRDAGMEKAVNYDVLETLKNCSAFSGKYDSKPVHWPLPHVIIFANIEPDLTRVSDGRMEVFHCHQWLNREDKRLHLENPHYRRPVVVKPVNLESFNDDDVILPQAPDEERKEQPARPAAFTLHRAPDQLALGMPQNDAYQAFVSE